MVVKSSIEVNGNTKTGRYDMTSTQALIGLFWLPGVIGVFFLGMKVVNWIADWLIRER